MYHFVCVAQVALISALLLITNAQSVYDHHHHSSSHLGTPDIKVIKVERPSVDGITDQRELLIVEGQRPYQGHHLAPHVVSLEKVTAQHHNPASLYYPQYASGYTLTHHVPHAQKYNYGKPDQPYLVAVDDLRPPTLYSPGKHTSVLDVHLPAQGPHLYDTYLKGKRELSASFPNPIKDALIPDIDVRSSIPTRAVRSTDDEESKIVFPQSADDTDDSVEILAPLRELREVQIGRPEQNPVVDLLYRYAVPVAKYPQQYLSRGWYSSLSGSC